MGSLQLEPSWEVIQFNMNSKVFALACMAALAGAAPAAEAEADAQFLGYADHHVAAPLAHAVAAPAVAPVAYHAAPAPTCVTEEVILVTQVCTPTAEEVCSTETVATQEIEYEKKCTEIVDTLCDAPVAHAAAYYGKREADAEAEAVAPAAAPLPVAHAVAHSVTETVKHACREVTTEH